MKLSEIVRRKEGIMRILSGSLVLVLLLGTVPVVWAQADPAKEIADINRKRGEAGAKGEIVGLLADVADNVVDPLGRAGFRNAGEQAVSALLTHPLQNYSPPPEMRRP